jgi:tetratricopeptide (TPR) repeat protein
MTLRSVGRAAVLLLASVAPALAGDGQVVLRFRDGRLLPGKVLSVDEKGVKHASEQGTATWPWESITTYGQYEARAAVTAEDDGPGRLALGRWCLDAGLPGEGRKEIQQARGLGAGASEELDGLLSRCDREQAERAFAEADRRLEAGDFDGALAALTSYLKQAPLSEWTDRGREKAADVVRRREADEARRRLEEKRLRKDDAEAKRLDAIREFIDGADGARTRAGVLVLVALREEQGGSITIFRQSLEKAEQEYIASRRSYEKARRLAGDERPLAARTALSGRNAVDGRLLDLYLRLARKLVESKSWKDAQEALDRALRIDPVNAEGLDMQDKVKANWRPRKASDLTNASGHTSDGTSDR